MNANGDVHFFLFRRSQHMQQLFYSYLSFHAQLAFLPRQIRIFLPSKEYLLAKKIGMSIRKREREKKATGCVKGVKKEKVNEQISCRKKRERLANNIVLFANKTNQVKGV